MDILAIDLAYSKKRGKSWTSNYINLRISGGECICIRRKEDVRDTVDYGNIGILRQFHYLSNVVELSRIIPLESLGMAHGAG